MNSGYIHVYIGDKRVVRLPIRDAFKEEQHPRGQPGNAGEFAKTSGGKKETAKKQKASPKKVVVSPNEPNKSPEQVFNELRKEAPPGYEKHWDDYLENYESINELLRFGAAKPHLTKQTVDPATISGIKNYLAKTKTTKPLTLFRGIGQEYAVTLKQQLAKASPDKPLVIDDKGFVSTTTDTDILDQYGSSDYSPGIKLSIDIPKGTHAAAIGNESESEVLLQQGTKLVLTGERDKSTGYYKATVDQSHFVNGAPKPDKKKPEKTDTTVKTRHHPDTIEYNGETHHFTGKVGVHNSGETAAEYEGPNYSRIWHRLPSGKIEED